ncbi:MAG: WecB/TagA/CpsF family glycosyltransferase [Candidatus Rokubacteria bacterium]|nr:WecB/TagA/CpsF family glycosyltransferase [Candidatus Rokubacteria bacterium]
MISDTFHAVAQWMITRAQHPSSTPTIICHVNVNNYYHFVRSPGLLNALTHHADLILDGIGMKFGAFLLGKGWRADLNGTDLFPMLMRRAVTARVPIYLLGATETVVRDAAWRVQTMFPGIRLAGFRSGYFDIAREPEIVADINRSGAGIVLVGRGCPLQEQFAIRQRTALTVPMLWMVGGLLDFVSQRKPRAFPLLRRLRLEWLFRFGLEPRDKWLRNIVAAPWFLWHVLSLRRQERERRHASSRENRRCGRAAGASDGKIPLLITMDLELAYDHDRRQQHAALERLIRDCDESGIPLTVFSTADAGDEFSEEIRSLLRADHEVGCHGVAHDVGEDFGEMPATVAERLIGEATLRLYQNTGQWPRCFRGPRMTTSATTQAALVRHGYAADFSVCPQRLDSLRFRGGTLHRLLAPRQPYRPSIDSPFHRGDAQLHVVPLSTIGLPFVSGVLYLFGLRLMKTFFRLLVWEARRRGTAIVYLFHSYEFSQRTAPGASGWCDGGRRGGRHRWHHRLYEQDREYRYATNLGLLRYMCAYEGVMPTTGARLVARLEEERCT